MINETTKRPISSATTLMWKYIFPGLWIPFMGVGGITAMAQSGVGPGRFLFPLLWLVVSGYFIWFAARLKVVSIDDDFIYVSQFRQEIQIPLANIVGVKQNWWTNPKLITLTLNQPSEFGTQIVFVPTSLFLAAWRSHPIVDELERAVHAAVQRRRFRY